MDVLLYVYDLSNGLAKQASAALLGVQIDAVYHTSIIYGGIEYFFGRGIQMSTPGNTHHGRPMEVIVLGETHIPEDVVQEYLTSLKDVYSAESYDLFLHNCNNFSNDLAMFLVGKGIPDHITSLPQTVMNTPFGQMLRPTIDSAMRSITQAPDVPAPSQASLPSNHGTNRISLGQVRGGGGVVHYPKSISELDTMLEAAKNSCAVIFFTSVTCPPCKMVYPTYDSLAAEAGSKATLIKVDVSQVYDIAARYRVRATPTFYTFLKGEKQEEWAGADPARLLGNVRLLIQMAFPPHPHSDLSLPAFRQIKTSPILYTKIPPLDKLLPKLGVLAQDPSIEGIVSYLRNRLIAGSREAKLPDLSSFSLFIRSRIAAVPQESAFAVVDLLRTSLSDPRVSGYFAAENGHKTILALFSFISEASPYNLRLVTVQAACNLFSTPLYIPHILHCQDLTSQILSLVTTGLLDTEKANIRAVASSLAFNLSVTVYKAHEDSSTEDSSSVNLPENEQVALAASLIESLDRESESADVMKLLLSSLGLLAYGRKEDGEVSDLLTALEAKSIVQKKKSGTFNQLSGLANDIVKIVEA